MCLRAGVGRVLKSFQRSPRLSPTPWVQEEIPARGHLGSLLPKSWHIILWLSKPDLSRASPRKNIWLRYWSANYMPPPHRHGGVSTGKQNKIHRVPAFLHLEHKEHGHRHEPLRGPCWEEMRSGSCCRVLGRSVVGPWWPEHCGDLQTTEPPQCKACRGAWQSWGPNLRGESQEKP